jgi:hypothetical protein
LFLGREQYENANLMPNKKRNDSFNTSYSSNPQS